MSGSSIFVKFASDSQLWRQPEHAKLAFYILFMFRMVVAMAKAGKNSKFPSKSENFPGTRLPNSTFFPCIAMVTALLIFSKVTCIDNKFHTHLWIKTQITSFACSYWTFPIACSTSMSLSRLYSL